MKIIIINSPNYCFLKYLIIILNFYSKRLLMIFSFLINLILQMRIFLFLLLRK